MSARSKARKRALDLLFESEIRGIDVLGLAEQRTAEAAPPVPPYGSEIVRGVQAHRGAIDDLLAKHAQGWTVPRMPAVDRNILRIAVWELLWADDVPDGVAISEAVLLARDLSTDSSPAFVNGLLARVAEVRSQPGSEESQLAAPAQAEPEQAEPAQAEPEPVQAQPERAESAQAEAGQAQPGQDESERLQSGHAEAGQKERGPEEPEQSSSEQPQSGQAQSGQAESGQAGPGQDEPGQTPSGPAESGPALPEQRLPEEATAEHAPGG